MPRGRKPLAAISFDDAYANVVINAVPVLRRYGVPATIFVVTSVVGHTGPMPFDRWSTRHAGKTPAEVTRPATWSELEECLEGGLVKLGGHSHRHLNGRTAVREQLAEEAQFCHDTLRRQFGGERFSPLYAYPYGCRRLGSATPVYAEMVKSAGFESAFTSDLGAVTANADPFFIPRIEAHPLDNSLILRSKLRGAVAGYWFTDRHELVHDNVTSHCGDHGELSIA
jgi:peptidoglycan/xylan/chitin deacetylase (PgdA/CDA1 family)